MYRELVLIPPPIKKKGELTGRVTDVRYAAHDFIEGTQRLKFPWKYVQMALLLYEENNYDVSFCPLAAGIPNSRGRADYFYIVLPDALVNALVADGSDIALSTIDCFSEEKLSFTMTQFNIEGL